MCEKRVNRNIFCPKLKIEDVLLIYFELFVRFCEIIYSNTNSLKLLQENSSLVLEKIFYTSATCATCDKFHVWLDCRYFSVLSTQCVMFCLNKKKSWIGNSPSTPIITRVPWLSWSCKIFDMKGMILEDSTSYHTVKDLTLSETRYWLLSRLIFLVIFH